MKDNDAIYYPVGNVDIEKGGPALEVGSNSILVAESYNEEDYVLDTLVVNSRFPEMSIEGRRQIENILIREEYPKGAIALNEGEVAHEIVFVGKGNMCQWSSFDDFRMRFEQEVITFTCRFEAP